MSAQRTRHLVTSPIAAAARCDQGPLHSDMLNPDPQWAGGRARVCVSQGCRDAFSSTPPSLFAEASQPQKRRARRISSQEAFAASLQRALQLRIARALQALRKLAASVRIRSSFANAAPTSLQSSMLATRLSPLAGDSALSN